MWLYVLKVFAVTQYPERRSFLFALVDYSSYRRPVMQQSVQAGVRFTQELYEFPIFLQVNDLIN